MYPIDSLTPSYSTGPQAKDQGATGGIPMCWNICNFCGKRGHSEDGCWKKNPDKAPDWLKEKWAKSGGGKETGNVEVCVAAIENSDFHQARC